MAPRRPKQTRTDVSPNAPDGGPVEGLDAAACRDLSDALVAWFHLRKRSLPWRDAPTPYRVWVSEIMLQQTQVDTVKPYFERFLERFPDVETLAAAPLDDVLSAWSGLGYYRRARFLHAGAIAVVRDHGGAVPRDVAGLLSVPGIGRYTAGAIASIAYGLAEPLVDGNVQRVLSRLVAMDDTVDGTAGTRRLWALATALVAGSDPSAHNQGLMELGALVCTPTRPDCEHCPWRDRCRAHLDGREVAFPKKTPKKAPRTLHAVAAVVRPAAGSPELLFERRPEAGLLAGLWGLPMVELSDVDDPGEPEAPTSAGLDALARHVAGLIGQPLVAGRVVGRVFHQFTHRSLHLDLVDVAPKGGPVPPASRVDGETHRWLAPANVGDAVALSTLSRKVLTALKRGGAPTQLALDGAVTPRRSVRRKRASREETP